MTTKIVFPLKRLGAVAPRNAAEIEDSNWFLGCETLDRGLWADFDQYKEYLCPLGIKYLRFQGRLGKNRKRAGSLRLEVAGSHN